MVSQRTTKRGTECPCCSGHRFAPGEFFADLFPVVAASWDADRNFPKRPGDFSPHSNERVWWTCERGHFWETTIDKRARGQGCPRCTSKSSAPEIRIFCELRPFFPDVRHRHRLDGLRLEVDVYVPSIALVIQYDSVYFHARRVDADARMSQDVLDAGHRLIRLRDGRLPDVPGTLRRREEPIFPFKTMAVTTRGILDRCTVASDLAARLESYLADGTFAQETAFLSALSDLPRPPQGTSVAERRPDLVAEWDREANGALTLDLVSHASAVSVWWRCPARGHSYPALPFNRTRGSGCPYCAGLGGAYVDVADSRAIRHPELAREWHPDLNGEIRPEQVLPQSNKRAWWRCAEGHQWPAVIASRTNGRGCRYCSMRKFHPDHALAVEAPALAAEWDFAANGSATPETVSGRSKTKFWWRCPDEPGHSYRVSVYTRYLNGSGCPECRAGRKPLRPGRRRKRSE